MTLSWEFIFLHLDPEPGPDGPCTRAFIRPYCGAGPTGTNHQQSPRPQRSRDTSQQRDRGAPGYPLYRLVLLSVHRKAGHEVKIMKNADRQLTKLDQTSHGRFSITNTMRKEISFADICNIYVWHDSCAVLAWAKFVAVWPVIEFQIVAKKHKYVLALTIRPNNYARNWRFVVFWRGQITADFTHILQGYFRLSLVHIYWSNPDEYRYKKCTDTLSLKHWTTTEQTQTKLCAYSVRHTVNGIVGCWNSLPMPT